MLETAKRPKPRLGTYSRPATSEDNPITGHQLDPETVVWVTTASRDIIVRVVIEPSTCTDPQRLIALDIASPAHRRVEQIIRKVGDFAWSHVCEGAGCGHVWIPLTEPNPGMLTMIGLKVLNEAGLISKARGNRILHETTFVSLLEQWNDTNAEHITSTGPKVKNV
jgi:hypothetical protein